MVFWRSWQDGLIGELGILTDKIFWQVRFNPKLDKDKWKAHVSMAKFLRVYVP